MRGSASGGAGKTLRRFKPSPQLAVALALVALIVAFELLFWRQLPQGLAAPLALILVTVALWATGAIPEHVTALLFFSVATVAGLAAPEVIFQGFQLGAFWLVLSGIVLGASVARTGLGDKIGAGIKRASKGSYPRALVAAALGGTALTFVVPAAIPRVVLLVPICTAVAESLGHEPGSEGHAGIVMTALLATVVPSFAILTANLPNLVLLGAAESAYGLQVGYLEYLWWNYPVLGLLKAITVVGLGLALFRPGDSKTRADKVDAPPNAGGLNSEQRRVLLVLAAALLLWATDGVHGVAPAWAGLACATFCLLPGVGFIDRQAFSRELNFAPLIYIAGVLGLVALVDDSGIGDRLGEGLLRLAGLEEGQPLQSYAKLLGVSGAIALLVTHPNIPAILVPAAGGVADATGLALEGVLAIQVAAFSLLFLPYQTAPMAIGVALAGVRLGLALKFLALNALVSLLVLSPLQGLWLWRLGLLGP